MHNSDYMLSDNFYISIVKKYSLMEHCIKCLNMSKYADYFLRRAILRGPEGLFVYS